MFVRRDTWRFEKHELEKRGWVKNHRNTYYFDIEKCKHCPFKEGCYTEGDKNKTNAVTIKSNEHSEREQFQQSEYFKEKSKLAIKLRD